MVTLKSEVPEKVLIRIADHFRKVSPVAAQRAWGSASDEEDCITGDFLSQLRKDNVPVKTAGGSWRWSVNYRKIRGRGPGAEEKLSGADGIFEVTVQLLRREIRFQKGLLFQAKKQNRIGSKETRKEIEKMEKLAASANAVFVYGPESFHAMDGSELLRASAGGSPTRLIDAAQPIGEYIADRFLGCLCGAKGLTYNELKRQLQLPNGKVVHGDIEHSVQIVLET